MDFSFTHSESTDWQTDDVSRLADLATSDGATQATSYEDSFLNTSTTPHIDYSLATDETADLQTDEAKATTNTNRTTMKTPNAKTNITVNSSTAIYIGTFGDNGSNRDLPIQMDTSGIQMTVDICVDFCKSIGSLVAGLQYG